MITRENLPQGFIPYGELNVCSNHLVGGGHLVVIGENLPVVVGSGPQPMVWLEAPTNKQAKEFVTLVSASVSKYPAVSVVNDSSGLLVLVGKTKLLRIKQETASKAIIDILDLRPIGLNIYGDANTLQAGGASFSGNTFMGVGTLIAYGVGA